MIENTNRRTFSHKPQATLYLRLLTVLVLISIFCAVFSACDENKDANTSSLTRPSGISGQPVTPPQTGGLPNASTSPSPSSSQASTLSSSSSPSPSPILTPTPAAAITNPAQLSILSSTLPGFVNGKLQADGSRIKAIPDFGNIVWWHYAEGTKLLKDYQAAEPVAFGVPSTFTQIPGVLTFRGNNYRDAPAYGTADVTQKKLEVVWTKNIGAISGTGTCELASRNQSSHGYHQRNESQKSG
jgi:hypothetical protein